MSASLARVAARSLAPDKPQAQRTKAAEKLFEALDSGALSPEKLIRQNAVIPLLLMVQSVKRTADLAPTEDNDAATMAMADAAMTVLGWLSGAGEHLLGEEGWFICTADDESRPIYVRPDGDKQEESDTRPHFEDWPWEKIMLLELIDLITPVPHGNGLQWKVRVVAYTPADKVEQSVSVIDVCEDDNVRRQLVKGVWHGSEGVVECEMDAADNAAFLHWDSELFGAVATAGTATQKRRVLVIGARDPALLHALAKAGLGLVVLETTDSIAAAVSQHFGLAPPSPVRIVGSRLDVDGTFDAVFILDESKDRVNDSLLSWVKAHLNAGGTVAIRVDDRGSAQARQALLATQLALGWGAVFADTREDLDDGAGVLIGAETELARTDAAIWGQVVTTMGGAPSVQASDWDVFD